MMDNGKMPAMPVRDADNEPLRVGLFPVYSNGEFATGLTKREMMAMHMMQGLISANATYGGRTDARDFMAKDAVAHADALLAELEKQQ
ncbi:MAG: hypothetical protein ACRCXB_26510 [Aeromonadaceae bacterium]